ncbi:hypothetical protein Poli38472_008824 [Pythium oligandrum]|uniref:Nucleotide-diphospho-sugar transferase n=1 Tax=Pythium oligandrum TaxID=41045 RepID=A0A8K1FBI5_PYTOL|nr:hypothetical protein Poli38472_008824 [Pythium oligandrum]|eukprot:TMW56176.1 hypothetical protein Poli38472_008824 [Pythium oligandrum]
MTTATRRTVLYVFTAAICVLAIGFIGSLSGFLSTDMPREWIPTNWAIQDGAKFLRANSLSYDHALPEARGSGSMDMDMDVSIQRESGVIICLHDAIVSMGASLIRELRCLGNQEVIQVYHCLNELSDESKALLTRNDAKVEIIDACSELLPDPNVFNNDEELANSFQNYWIKPLAMYHTRLTDVILLDADVVLLQDPAEMRALSGYNRTGTTFFHDRIRFMRKFFNKQSKEGKQMLREILETFNYQLFGLEGPQNSEYLNQSFAYREETGHEMDSSMVFMDKLRAGKAVQVLKHLILNTRFRYNFSWGDKEAFWLAYELAHQDYFFSPWGLSLVDSVPNADMHEHPESLCGSMAHFIPTENEQDPPELLYVNGKALLEPYPGGVDKALESGRSRMFNVFPTHVTPRYRHSSFDLSTRKTFECLDDLGSTPIDPSFHQHLLQRRRHYFALETHVYQALDRCGV